MPMLPPRDTSQRLVVGRAGLAFRSKSAGLTARLVAWSRVYFLAK